MNSTSQLRVRFAVISLLCVAGVAGAAAWAGSTLVSSREHAAARRGAERLVATPVRALLGDATGPLSEGQRAQLDALVQAELQGGIVAVRIGNGSGGVYEAGSPSSSERLPAADASGERTAADGSSRFVVATDVAGWTIEVEQDAAPIESRISDGRRMIWAGAVIGAALLFAALQFAFSVTVRALSRDHSRLMRLYRAGEGLRASLDLHDVLTQLTRDAAILGRADFALVALFDSASGDLVLRATYERQNETFAHYQRSVEDWLLRRAVITKTSIVTAQPANTYRQFFADERLDGQVNVLCVPVCLRDGVFGALAVVQLPGTSSKGFAEAEVRQVLDLAAQGAMAIEQAQLFAKVRSYAEEVELSYDSTLKALMAALDAKDELTEGHCERVARLTTQLAKEVGLDGQALIDVERGALLHDVGKIGVPDAVLQKPEALNDREWEAMRKHPLLAGVMVSKVGFLEGATPILLYHHERWDGTGYPFGLAGGNIPLEARIFSIVDAYDAMTSYRPYRDAMPHVDAMAELRANTGTQFDPDLFVAFDRLMGAREDLHARPQSQRDAAGGHDHEHGPLTDAA